jgi:hypothetical protein
MTIRVISVTSLLLGILFSLAFGVPVCPYARRCSAGTRRAGSPSGGGRSSSYLIKSQVPASLIRETRSS